MENKMVINKNSKNIKVAGHVGRWDVIDVGTCKGKEAFLLEHTTYGEDAGMLIVDSAGKVLKEDVFDGFPLEEWN